MKKRGTRLGSLFMALMVVAGMALAMPMAAGAVNMQGGKPAITVNSTEIGFAGHTWVVVGDNASGVLSGDADHLTLLLKNGDSFSNYAAAQFNSSGNSNYVESDLQLAMQGTSADGGIYAAIGTANSQEQGLIVSRTLNDVAIDDSGSRQTLAGQYVWPLSDIEFNAIGNSTVLSYGSRWWLRSPAVAATLTSAVRAVAASAATTCTARGLCVPL